MKLFMLKTLLLLIIPALILVNINYNSKTEFAYDPNYTYLFNGLNIATHFGNVGYWDHPGTPVFLFSAMVIKITHIFRDTSDDLTIDILKNPQYYVNTIVWSFAVINVFLLFLIGFLILKATKQILFGLLFQTIPYISKSVIPWSFQMLSPEPLILGSVIVFIIFFLLKFYFDKDIGEITLGFSKNKKLKVDKLVVILGICIGFCLATKIDTFPLVIFPLMFISRCRNKLIFFFVSILAFVIFTLPIIKFYSVLFLWIKKIVIHTDLYGSGDSGFIDFKLFYQHLIQAINFDPLIFIIILLTIAVFIVQLIRKKFDKLFKILFTLILVQLFDIIMVMKHFNLHYLIPIVPTLAINLFIIFRILELKKIALWLVVLPIIVFIVFLNIDFSKYIPGEYQEADKTNGINIYSFGCKSPIYGLKFGNEYSLNINSEMLEKIYGKQYFYNIWTQKVTDWKDTLTLDSIRKFNKNIYLYGLEQYLQDWPTKFKWKSLGNGKFLIENDTIDRKKQIDKIKTN